ncbi:MAG TPA: hypothetical protein VGK09_12590 [Rhodocyclaceae bacterium]|jgi:hypothetical protein
MTIMLTLPSGRRVGFSLDRFHEFLKQMDPSRALAIAECLEEPDDLLFVLDAVHFSLADGSPYFAGYVASDWSAYAADWSNTDRQALQEWLSSDEARFNRAEAIDYIKTLLLEHPTRNAEYPYMILGYPLSNGESRLRQ